MFDYVIVGAGLAGAVLAQQIASVLDKRVLIYEKRSHIGGNCYDEVDENGILVHRYGPHLFHTDSKKVVDYLTQFTDWQTYVHEVLASVDGKYIPIPFNINTLYEVFEYTKASFLETKLVGAYGKGEKIPVLHLLEQEDPDLRELGKYVYEKIFVNYTSKQWGLKPDEIDPQVTARVPVICDRDNRYFTDKFQLLPSCGYTSMIETMLQHPNIEVKLSIDALNHLSFKNDQIYVDNKPFSGKLIYTGMIDALFGYRFGDLPYRSLRLDFETQMSPLYQSNAVINYPNEHAFTRITEFKHIHPVHTKKTTILKEFPQSYIKNRNEPFYPIFTNENQALYEKYKTFAKKFPDLVLLGRLAEYRYYDMDDIVLRALELFKSELKCT